MRLLAVSLALFLGATALPASENAQGEQAGIDASVQTLPVPTDENADIFAHGGSEDPATSSTSTQKDGTNTDYLIVDVYKAKQWSGEHERMWPFVKTCYNVTSDWNDAIASLAISEGFACRFYPNGDCASDSLYLDVGESRRYMPNLGLFGWDNIISSYRCWN